MELKVARGNMARGLSLVAHTPIDDDVCPTATEPTIVHLTVYDLDPCWNALCHPLGLGIYKTGIEFDGVEYTFDYDRHGPPEKSGVTAHPPIHESAEARQTPMRARISLGYPDDMAVAEMHDRVLALAEDWVNSDYEPLENNCNHWTAAAARALRVATGPRWTHGCLRALRVCTGAACVSS